MTRINTCAFEDCLKGFSLLLSLFLFLKLLSLVFRLNLWLKRSKSMDVKAKLWC